MYRARSGSSGRAQPRSWFQASRSASNSRSWPGGAILSARPLDSSTRAVSVWMCGVPSASRCRTAQVAYWSASRPANAVASHSSRTWATSWSLGLSSGDHAMTPDVYRHWCGLLSATWATRCGSPRSTVTSARSSPRWSRSWSRYPTAPPALPWPWLRNLMCTGQPPGPGRQDRTGAARRAGAARVGSRPARRAGEQRHRHRARAR